MRFRHALVTGVVTTTVLCSSIASVEARNEQINYQAQISWTSYGIPHIKAPNWAGLGYGYGYAFAQDNVCVLARDVLAANGTQSRYFGPGANNANIVSDSVYAMVNSQARVAASWATLDTQTTDLLTGYADGYNRYVRDTGKANLPADCRDAAWVQPITGEDVYRTLRKLLVRASTGNFVLSIFSATPPAPAVPVAFSSNSSAAEALLADAVVPAGTADEASRLLAATGTADEASRAGRRRDTARFLA
jgi:acyl-homoserine-lactone acylase